MTLRVLAKPFRVPAASFSGRQRVMSAKMASAPLFRVDPQSPSPTLHRAIPFPPLYLDAQPIATMPLNFQ